jgi:hypothetical protein
LPPKSRNEVAPYGFRLRSSIGYIPSPVLLNERKRRVPPDISPGCLEETTPTAYHIFTRCNIADRNLLKTDQQNRELLNQANPSLLASGRITPAKALTIVPRKLSSTLSQL